MIVLFTNTSACLVVQVHAHTYNMQISRIPKKFPFVVTNLTVDFYSFLLLPSKIHADAINDLQYCGAKMATMSEMFVKYRHKVYF